MAHVRDAEAIARAFHETSELLAVEHGYPKEPHLPWSKVPEQDKGLMIEICRELINHDKIRPGYSLFAGWTAR